MPDDAFCGLRPHATSQDRANEYNKLVQPGENVPPIDPDSLKDQQNPKNAKSDI